MIIDYINAHQTEFWMVAGLVLMAIEVLLFGFSTLILFFAGIGAVITGLFMMLGVLPESWTAGVSSFGIITGLCSVLMWKPLKNMQHAEAPSAGQSSDLIGLEFVLTQAVSHVATGTHSYSGVQWKVELDSACAEQSIAAGTRVRVASVDAGIFRVLPVA